MNGRINTKFLESTTTSSTPVLSVPSIRPNPNAIDTDYGYPKGRPSILVRYNAEPIDGSLLNSGYVPVTTYRPFFSSTTPSPSPSSPTPTPTVLPPISSSTAVSFISSPITTPQPPIAVPSPITVPSTYFEPPQQPQQQYNSDANNSPIIRIKPYSTPIAAYTIDQINNELRQPIPSAIALDDVGPSAPFAPIVVTSSTGYGESSTISPIASTAAGVPQYTRRLPFINRGEAKRPVAAFYQPNQLDVGNGIDELRKYDRYNARTPNGFGYFLPRHYHEETYREANPNNRDGSYGYIDPFGIRRVVYYRASPDGGFKVRKNNRYVGFHAKPYDSKK